jgi:hypothetical protein
MLYLYLKKQLMVSLEFFMKHIHFFLFLVIFFSVQTAYGNDSGCQNHVYCNDFERCYKYAVRSLNDAEKYQKEYLNEQKRIIKEKNTDASLKDNKETNHLVRKTALQFICAAEYCNFQDKTSQPQTIIKRKVRIGFLRIRHAFLIQDYEMLLKRFESIERGKNTFDKYVETYDAYFYAGRAYYEIKKYSKAREVFIKYIGFKNIILLNQDQYDMQKLINAYYYATNSLSMESNNNAKQIFTELTNNLSPQEIIEMIPNIDNTKIKHKIDEWIDTMNEKFAAFVPSIEDYIPPVSDFRLRFYYNHQDNIGLLPDELSEFSTHITETYDIESDNVYGVICSAQYHLIDQDKHKLGIDGMYYENFHDQNKEYDFRGFSARTFFNYTIIPRLTINSHYAFMRYCLDSKKFQSSHDIGARLLWQFHIMTPLFETFVQYKSSFIDDYQNETLDGKYSVLSGGIQNVSDLSSFILFKNARFQTEYQIENRSTREYSDKTYSGINLALGINYIDLFQHVDLYCNFSYRKRVYDQDDHFFAVYREEKKKVIKAGADWHYWDDAVTLSFSVKRTKNDASFELFEYTNTEYLLSLELKPFLFY